MQCERKDDKKMVKICKSNYERSKGGAEITSKEATHQFLLGWLPAVIFSNF